MSIVTPGPCPHCGVLAVVLADAEYRCVACPWRMPAPWNAGSWATARKAFLGGVDHFRKLRARTGDLYVQAASREAVTRFQRTLALLRLHRLGRLPSQHSGQALLANAG